MSIAFQELWSAQALRDLFALEGLNDAYASAGRFPGLAYTHLYQGDREQLDHVLVSEQFYDHSQNRCWSFKEQRIWNDHLVEGGANGPKRDTSEHGVVCARFVWDPAKP